MDGYFLDPTAGEVAHLGVRRSLEDLELRGGFIPPPFVRQL